MSTCKCVKQFENFDKIAEMSHHRYSGPHIWRFDSSRRSLSLSDNQQESAQDKIDTWLLETTH